MIKNNNIIKFTHKSNTMKKNQYVADCIVYSRTCKDFANVYLVNKPSILNHVLDSFLHFL